MPKRKARAAHSDNEHSSDSDQEHLPTNSSTAKPSRKRGRPNRPSQKPIWYRQEPEREHIEPSDTDSESGDQPQAQKKTRAKSHQQKSRNAKHSDTDSESGDQPQAQEKTRAKSHRQKSRNAKQPPQPNTIPSSNNQATMHEILSQLKTLQDHVFRNQDYQNPGTSGTTPPSSRPPSSKEKCNNYSDFESDSEGELSHGNKTDSSDDEFENYDKPHTSFGSMVDSMVSRKLQNKILDNRYVEMAELLPGFQTKLSDEFVMRPGKHNDAKLVKCRPKYDISFKQWCEGFDIYMSVYIDKATSVSFQNWMWNQANLMVNT